MADIGMQGTRAVVAEAMRPDTECAECGAGFYGKAPDRCPKCGGYSIKKPAPIFEDLTAAFRRVKMAIAGAEAILVKRKHRKEAPILRHLRRATEAVENAMSAVFIDDKGGR